MAVTTTTANGPQTGGGGGSFATITGDPSDNAALQAALDAKAPLTSPAFATSARFSYATVSTVPYFNASRDLVSSAVTPTELGYLTGVTSAIQTQLDAKAADSAVMKLTGTQSAAGVKTFSDTTDASSATVGGTIMSGGLAVAKKIYSGTGINVVTGNVLITSGTCGRDTGSSGLMTDCPTAVFATTYHVKTAFNWAANSATTGLTTVVDSATSITTKSGSDSILSVTSTNLLTYKELRLGNGENTILSFGTNTGFDSNNAAAVVVFQYNTTGRDNWVFCARIYGTMRRTDSGTEYGQIAKSMMWSREGGTVTVRGAIQDIHPDNYVTMAPTGITQDASGNFARIIFTGEVSKRIEGNFYVFLTMHST